MRDRFDELTQQVAAGASSFLRRYPHPFLVRKPRASVEGASIEDGPGRVEYHTAAVERDSDGLMPWQWWVVEVRKKPENPFPDHVTIGRATNCDVVLRFPFVSKLHARFLLRDGRPWSVEDCGSSNGLLRNGRKLEPHVAQEIAPGDRLSFGNLVVDYLLPEGLFELLRAR